ncbi:MAG: hypothetical protein ABFR90_09630 [Planctomycetota bacterium]
MTISKKTIRTILIATFIAILLIGGFVYFVYSSMLVKIRYENLRGLATALTVYINDNNDMLPDLDNWCDRLIAEADCAPESFQGIIDSQEGVCGYALNKNLEGLKFSELPDKVILAFEAKGHWNLSGGSELTKTSKHKNIAVIFVDGYVDFVKKEEIDKLKWKP